MASISIVVTDNKNGVISNSYNFTDAEIKRIGDALGIVYKGRVFEDEMDENVMDSTTKMRALFSFLSKNLVQSILNTVYDTELQATVAIAKQNINKMEVRDM